MTDTGFTPVRIGQLCYQFKLLIMGAESLARFTGDAHSDALPTFLEILEQKAKAPRHRRINRLRKEFGLPAVETW